MPAYPPETLAAAEAALREIASKEPWFRPGMQVEEVARAILDAAAPVLAEAVAQKILAHMEERQMRARPGLPARDAEQARIAGRAWRRHFGIAARIAAGAFDTREDQLRKAAEAIKRGDFIACDIPEVPREVREEEGP